MCILTVSNLRKQVRNFEIQCCLPAVFAMPVAKSARLYTNQILSGKLVFGGGGVLKTYNC